MDVHPLNPGDFIAASSHWRKKHDINDRLCKSRINGSYPGFYENKKKHIHATQNADEIIYSLLQILQILRGRLRDAPLPKRHAHLELIHGWTRQDRPNDFDYAR
jgi:hypothetical protein